METIRGYRSYFPLAFSDLFVPDVPIGGTLEAMRVLEAKLGIDLTSPQAVLLPKLWYEPILGMN